MFFRRMFARKDNTNNTTSKEYEGGDQCEDDDDDEEAALKRHQRTQGGIGVNGDSNNNHFQRNNGVHHQRQFGVATAPAGISGGSSTTITPGENVGRRGTASASTAMGAMQLTPLWEYVLRHRQLPDTHRPVQMFGEFLERLRDLEWQVRQHALRVLVDVLVVMRTDADSYMEPLITPLVENLGHQAPTVRKGALDCLRVYLAETAMPETILLQIMDIGLNQRITNEPFGGRLTCGVLLSLPALVQATLHTAKRHFILRTAVDMLVQKMGQVMHQEITLKVLSKIRDLIGQQEFMEFMSHGAYREFELLCNVYGVGRRDDTGTSGSEKKNSANGNEGGLSWRLLAQNQSYPKSTAPSCWRSTSSEDEQLLDLATSGKVILETDIKINNDTLTMRILEASGDTTGLEESDSTISPARQLNSLDDEEVIICGRLHSARSEHDDAVLLLSDSDDANDAPNNRHNSASFTTTIVTPSTPCRTPKRVTFGGEVVKMRTPDSDATNASNNNNNNNSNSTNRSIMNGDIRPLPSSTVDRKDEALSVVEEMNSKITTLSLEIPNDNTKPLPVATTAVHVRPKTGQSPKREPKTMISSPTTCSNDINDDRSSPGDGSTYSVSPDVAPPSPIRPESTVGDSPLRSPFHRISVSPVDKLISPKAPHKQTEMLHNLQRDPSPLLQRVKTPTQQQSTGDGMERETPPPPKSWEDLDIVTYDTILDLRSGDWRHRLRGITQLEVSLRSTDNLAAVQPCLDTLLRTLLSAERNAEVAEEKRRLLMNLISRLPLENLEDRTVQILTGLCRQGGAGANRVCKALMQRLPPAAIVLKLISAEFLHAKSSRFREHALQMVMYALMTFPSTYFDTTTCIGSATLAALNRKRRVRQAALDVLAILGQVTTSRSVLDVVQHVSETRQDDGDHLVAAVKARLSRKQLPLVTADGQVEYTLRLPSPPVAHLHLENAGNGDNADVEWITAGVGSVSPTSMRRRAQRYHQTFVYGGAQHHSVDGISPNGLGSGSNNSEDMYTHHHRSTNGAPQRSTFELFGGATNHGKHPSTTFLNGSQNDHQLSPPYALQHLLDSQHTGHMVRKSNAMDYSTYLNRRLVAKSCSDSSMDGRSSDSMNTTSSSGGGGSLGKGAAVAVAAAVAASGAATNNCGGISGRFTRQAINSRFPAMDRMDLNATYVRVHKPPAYSPGMGAYAQLQQQQYNMSSTYPKMNYPLPPTQSNRRRSQQQPPPPVTQPNHKIKAQGERIRREDAFKTAESNSKQLSNANSSVTAITTKTQSNNNTSNDGSKTNNPVGTDNENLDGTYTIYPAVGQESQSEMVKQRTEQQQQQQSNSQNNNGTTLDVGNTVRRFVNVEKFIMQSKTSHANGMHPGMTTAQPTITTPTFVKSAEIVVAESEAMPTNDGLSSPATTVVGNLQELPTSENDVGHDDPLPITTSEWAEDEDDKALQSEDMVDAAADERKSKSPSLNSVFSKTESISTQMDAAPVTTMSRSQSLKSLMAQEQITEPNLEDQMVEQSVDGRKSVHSFVLVDGDEIKNDEDNSLRSHSQKVTPTKREETSRSQSPTIAELKAFSRRNSMIKSSESLYERRAISANVDPLDNTTESTSSATSSQLISTLPLLHTPLKQKSKTSHFLKRDRRRVSPVKESIKMVQPELYPTTLQRFEKPREALLKTFDQLDSSNWEVIISGLKSMVRLMRHHPDHLDNQMHMVCIQLTRSVRNLRSQVARAACQAATEIFTLRSKFVEQECDDLICALLHRTADTNRFIRGDSTRALESMCDNLAPPKILNILTTKGATHQNALVRTTTAKLLNRLIERLGNDRVYAMSRENRDKFFVTGANLLLEGSLETRCYAKALFRMLSEHPTYNRLLVEVIPKRTFRNVEKTLRSIRA